MIEYIFLVFVSFIELLISYIVFSHISERKHPVLSCILFGTLLFESAVALNVFLSNNILVNGIYFAAINVIFALVFFHISSVKAIFYSVILDIFSTALEFATIVLFSMLFKVNIYEYNNNFTLLILEGTISKTLYFIICLILVRVVGKDNNLTRFPLSFYIYPLSVIASLLAFWKICLDETLSSTSQLVFSIIGTVLFSSTVFLFITYQHNIKKENQMIVMQSELSHLQTEKTYYEILEHQDMQLLAYAHDAKNHLSTIKNLNKDAQIDKYIDEMSESLKAYNSVSRSGNITLDVIINKYLTECSLKGIAFKFDVRVSNLKCVDDFDLVTILGNLLDNAIEASEKSIQKFISLETDSRNAYSIIIVSNSCDDSPTAQGEELITTKKNSAIHGIGIKNVQKAVKKYDGDLSWEYNHSNKTFMVTVMIKEKPKG